MLDRRRAPLRWRWQVFFRQTQRNSQQSDGSASFAMPAVLKAARSTDTPAPAPGPQAGPLLDAKFSAGITSDYNYRGYTLSNHKPKYTALPDWTTVFCSPA